MISEKKVMKGMDFDTASRFKKRMRAMMINVQPGTFGKQCRILGKAIGCFRTPKFMIFGEDGQTKLSRLEGCVCGVHIALAVRRLKVAQRVEVRGR